MSIDDLTGYLLACEFGYTACEKDMNLQEAIDACSKILLGENINIVLPNEAGAASPKTKTIGS
jgi:hypothetical protein